MTSEDALLKAWAETLDLPFLEALIPDPEAERIIPEHLAHRYLALPLSFEGDVLTLAMANPRDIIALDDIGLITGFQIQPVLASAARIQSALLEVFGISSLESTEETVKDIAAQDFGSLDDGVGPARPTPAREAPADEVYEPGKAPRTLFAGMVPMSDGLGVLSLPADRGSWVVHAVGLRSGDWIAAEARVEVRPFYELALELPPFVAPGDVAPGRLTVVAGGGLLTLRRDGETVLEQTVTEGEAFPLQVCAGLYQARLCAPDGAEERIQVQVQAPGSFRSLSRGLSTLVAGQDLDPEGVIEFRTLSTPRLHFGRLLEATVDYSHSCCEQAAAKLIASAALWTMAHGQPATRIRAEASLMAGVRRMETVFMPGRGFAMYPGCNEPDPVWGATAAIYLQDLALLDRSLLSSILLSEVELALSMASDALRAYGIAWPPRDPADPRQAYALAVHAPDQAAPALEFARRTLKSLENPGEIRVSYRATAALVAATLLRLGDSRDRHGALRLANEVLSALEPSGRLYSTVDSVAAMALVSELSAHHTKGRVRIDGVSMSCAEAARLGPIKGSLEVEEGEALLEITRYLSHDWGDGEPGLLEASLDRASLSAGDRVLLRWRVSGGYQVGDLLWVCLPAALSRLEGGGQMKLFSIDLEGASQGVLELVATGVGSQHFRLCLRNMFEEERLGPSPLLRVDVRPREETQDRPSANPARLIPPGLWELNLETAREEAVARLRALDSGWWELSSGRFGRDAWLRRSGEGGKEVAADEAMRLSVALVSLAGLDLKDQTWGRGTVRLDDREYRVLAARTDHGWRVRVER